MYGERIGALSVVCESAEEAARVKSQLLLLIRPAYSNPPLYGARIVNEVLNNNELKKQWAEDCKGMADRIMKMRELLRNELEKTLGSKLPWKHITEQIGMFCYSGLTTPQVCLCMYVYMYHCGVVIVLFSYELACMYNCLSKLVYHSRNSL